MAYSYKAKRPLWLRVVGKILTRFGVQYVLYRDTPDLKWGIMFFKIHRELINGDKTKGDK